MAQLIEFIMSWYWMCGISRRQTFFRAYGLG